MDTTNKSNTSLGQNDSCFGCGGPHPWMWHKVIVCPHKDRLGIKETAKKNYKDWLMKYKARCKKRKDINFDDMSKQQQKKITKQVLHNLANSLTKDSTTSTIINNSSGQRLQSTSSMACPCTPTSLTFVVNVAVLSTLSSNKELLPTPTNFPLIRLILGTDIGQFMP
jgi:hypothetical protein